MARFFSSVQAKVTASLIGVLVLSVLVNNIFLRDAALNAQFQQLRDQLKVVAKIAAVSVDPALLRAIPLKREGVQTQAYRMINEKLQRIRRDNPKIAYVYILTKTDRPGLWQFVVDADPLQKRRAGITSYPGDKYEASRFPEMLKAWDAASVDKIPVRDEWGVTLSGYAPILDENGRTLAVVGVDMMAADVYAMQRALNLRVLVILLLGILLSIIAGMALSRRMIKPLQGLAEGARRISQGDLGYRVKVRGHDEIAELSAEFNTMAQELLEARKKNAEYFYGVIQSMIRIVEAKDPYTRGHSERVAEYAVKIARRMGFSPADLDMLKQISVLHDIGKLAVQDSILNKPSKLTDEEWEVVRRHPMTGEEILKPVLFDDRMLAAVRGHHERYDGKGYPDGLSEDGINMFAQILSVADAYDAMTSSRAYRASPMRSEAAAQELQKNKQGQFNPRVVETFCKILQEENN